MTVQPSVYHTLGHDQVQSHYCIVLCVCKHFCRGLKYHFTNKRTDGRYQGHYLPASPSYVVDKHRQQKLGTLVVTQGVHLRKLD